MARIISIKIFTNGSWQPYSIQQIISQDPAIETGVDYPVTIKSDSTAFVRLPATEDKIPTYILNIKATTAATATDPTWNRLHEKYAYTIESGTLPFVKPYIDKAIVYNDSGFGEETLLKMFEFIDGRVRIYSETDIDCKIIIKGEIK